MHLLTSTASPFRSAALSLGVAAVLGLPMHAAQCAEFFVDPSGSDAYAGTASAPWKTLQRAADQVGPGDRVTVRQGDYAGFHLTTSGTLLQPIEFIAEAGVVVNARNPRTPDGVNLEGASHVLIDGFAVLNMPRAGVRAVGPIGSFSEHVRIRNVVARGNFKWGILTGFVHDLLIENNQTSASIDEHGIYVSNSGDRPIVRNNRVWDNNKSGIQLNADVHAGLDGIITEAVVSGNQIFNNGLNGGSAVNLDGVQRSRIENNLLFNNRASGISLFQGDGAAGSIDNLVVNNTIHQPANGRWALNIQNGSTGNAVYNNILMNDHSFRGAIDISANSLDGFVSDYNVLIPRFTIDDGDSVIGRDAWQTATGQDGHSVIATPAELFVNPLGGDYRLLPTSPAVDAGTPRRAPRVDRVDAPRPWGLGHDIGAWELQGRPGDFNFDGHVDSTDLDRWKTAFGSAGGDLFLTWQREAKFLAIGANAVPVPEPVSWMPLAMGGAIVVFERRRRPRRRLGRHSVA